MISKFKLRRISVQIPHAIKCDICGRELIVDNPYEDPIDVSGYMAVFTYNDNVSPFKKEIHCCSSTCVCVAIDSIPFSGNVFIPDVSSSYFERSLGLYEKVSNDENIC